MRPRIQKVKKISMIDATSSVFMVANKVKPTSYSESPSGLGGARRAVGRSDELV